MRTHSFADSHGALRGAARLLVKAANWVEKQDRFFWHKVRLARFGPDIHFALSREVEEPFRVAHCVVLHLEPFRPGIVLGWYDKTEIDADDDNEIAEHLRRALTLRKPTQKELDSFDDSKPHGTGRPGNLRSGAATRSPAGRAGTSEPDVRVDGPASTGAGQ